VVTGAGYPKQWIDDFLSGVRAGPHQVRERNAVWVRIDDVRPAARRAIGAGALLAMAVLGVVKVLEASAGSGVAYRHLAPPAAWHLNAFVTENEHARESL
jgi:hypothetical protein